MLERPMAMGETKGGVKYDSEALGRIERLFWGDIWSSVPAAIAAEHGIEVRRFGSVQASLVGDLPRVGMLNLILGAAEPGAVSSGALAEAAEWARSRGVSPYVKVPPGLAGSEEAEGWLQANGFAPGYAWMKFLRDPHPPRFSVPADVEVVEVTDPEEEPFGMIAATGFGMPAWAAAFFAELPGRDNWRCYVARVDGVAQACGAMVIDGSVAELGVGATLEPARQRGCQLALLRRRIVDAAEAGCQTLFVETGERVEDRPAGSYRNILRAGFEEAYLCPNWRPVGGRPS
jgi:GNAT superfamily N-acetyltransferase